MQRGGGVGGPGLGQRQPGQQLPAAGAEQVRHRARMAEREQGGVDPVLQRGAVAHQVQPPAGPFPLGAHRRGGQPDRRHQIPAGQLGQHPGVDLVGLAGQRGQPLDLLRVGDLDLPARQLQLVVHEPGAVHRLDRRVHRPAELRPDPPGQRGQTTRLGQRRGHHQRRPRLVHHMHIQPRSTQVQPDVHHDNRPPSDNALPAQHQQACPRGEAPGFMTFSGTSRDPRARQCRCSTRPARRGRDRPDAGLLRRTLHRWRSTPVCAARRVARGCAALRWVQRQAVPLRRRAEAVVLRRSAGGC